MSIATKILGGLIATVLLVSVSFAIQRTFLGAVELGADPAPATSAAASAPASHASASSGMTARFVGEQDEATDLVRGASVRSPRTRNPTLRDRRGVASGRAEADSTGTLAPQREVADEPATGWSARLAALSNWLVTGSGGGGTPAAAATAATVGAAAPAPRQADGPQVKEVFFSTREDTACQPGDRQFVLDDVRDLYVCVVWGGVGGKHAEQLTFLSPDGQVYRTLTVPFITAGTASADATIEIDGQRLEAQPAGWGADGEVLVRTALPVAGTDVSQRMLVGSWTVEVGLNGRRIDQDNFELLQR